jgi:hypothetical protein
MAMAMYVQWQSCAMWHVLCTITCNVTIANGMYVIIMAIMYGNNVCMYVIYLMYVTTQ